MPEPGFNYNGLTKDELEWLRRNSLLEAPQPTSVKTLRPDPQQLAALNMDQVPPSQPRQKPTFRGVLAEETERGRDLVSSGVEDMKDPRNWTMTPFGPVPIAALGKTLLGGLDAGMGAASTVAGAGLDQISQATGISADRSNIRRNASDARMMLDVAMPELAPGASVLPRSGLTLQNARRVEGANAARRLEERGPAFAGAQTQAASGLDPTTAVRAAQNAIDTVKVRTSPQGSGPLWRGASLPDDPNVQRNLDKIISKTPEFEDILQYLTPEEVSAVTSQMGDKALRTYRLHNQDDVIGAAVAGAPKLGWYRESSNAMATIFGEDIHRFTRLLAALSPQTSVESNTINAARTWANWVKAGRPKDPNEILEIMGRSVMGNKGKDSVLDSWKNNAIRTLSKPEGTLAEEFRISGPKVDSFGWNTAGDLSRIANDAWGSNESGIPQDFFSGSMKGPYDPGYNAVYLGRNAALRQASRTMSDILGFDIEPAEVQEMGWSFSKAGFEQMAEGRGSGGPSLPEIVQQGLLDEKRISDVPDFANLFQDDLYGGPLREIGLGSEIDRAAGAAGRIGGRDLSAAARPEGLLRTARRLQSLYDTRQFISETAPWRARLGTAGGDGVGRQNILTPYRSGGRGLVPVEWGAKVRSHDIDPSFKASVARLDVDPVESFVEVAADGASRAAWVNKMLEAQSSRGVLGRSVDVYNPSAYKGSRLFATPDGSAGFAIKPDGELSSVVSMRGGGPRGFSDSALTLATQNGATWLNAFDTVLPAKYGRHGFKPVARLPFDEGMIRADWGDEAAEAFMEKIEDFNGGKPDLVFMVYDPDFTDKVANGLGGRLAKDWDDAMRIVEREKTNLVTKKPSKKAQKRMGGLLSEEAE